MTSPIDRWAQRQMAQEDHRHEMMMRDMRESNQHIKDFCRKHRWLGRLWWGKEISTAARANNV